MTKNVLFVQPFIIEHYNDQESLTQMLLITHSYLENFLKSKIRDINCSLLYLPDEQKRGNITIKSYKDSELFGKQMNKLLDTLDFEINQNTYICLSGTTSYYYLSSKLVADYFQKHHPEAIVIFGGAHATACPNDFVYNQSPMDYIIIGEGEQVLYEIVKNNYRKQNTPKVIIGKPIQELDDLPKLNLSLLDKYINLYDSISICLSRGCPFNCSFCMEKTMANYCKSIKRWRSYKPQRAIKEARIMIEYAQNFGIDRVGFVDPTFGSNRTWLEDFLKLWNFEDETSAVWVETRFDILNDKLIEKFQKKKFFLWYGLESCSKKMLTIMNKNIDPTTYLKKYDKIIKKHIDLGYLVMNNIIFGHPTETKTTCQESYTGLKRIKEKDYNESIYFSLRYFHAFPGSPVYNNIDFYNKKYGTEIYYRDVWWKKEELLHFGPYMVRPSSSLSLPDLIKLFTDYYEDLAKLSIKHIKKNRNFDSMGKIFGLKKQIESFRELGNAILDFYNKQQFNRQNKDFKATFSC